VVLHLRVKATISVKNNYFAKIQIEYVFVIWKGGERACLFIIGWEKFPQKGIFNFIKKMERSIGNK
jgi:hypothetical protein